MHKFIILSRSCTDGRVICDEAITTFDISPLVNKGLVLKKNNIFPERIVDSVEKKYT